MCVGVGGNSVINDSAAGYLTLLTSACTCLLPGHKKIIHITLTASNYSLGERNLHCLVVQFVIFNGLSID